MKKILLALLLLATPAFAGPLEPWQGGTGCETDSTYTVSQLPGSPNKGTICTISDGADETDCTVGGGTSENVCIYISGGSGVDYGWKQLDLDYTEVADSFYVTKDTNGGLPEPSVIPSCRNGTDGGVLGYNTSTHAFVCYDTTRLAVVASSTDVTTGLCYWSTSEGSIQCGNTTGVRTMLTKSVAATTYLALDGSNIMTAGIPFEGASADAWETTLNVVDPTGSDKTINLPDANGTVAVSASGVVSLSATGDISIADGAITEAKLKVVDAPADEECFTYETTTGDFEWQACGGGLDETAANLLYLRLDGANDPVTGDVYFSSGAQLSIGANEFTMTVNGTTYPINFSSHIDDASTFLGIELHRAENTTAASSPTIFGARDRGTLAAPTIVSSGDQLLTIGATGYDGTDYALSSRINFEVDGTPGNNDMPGRIEFLTSADGTQAPSVRLEIDSAGGVNIGEDGYLTFEGATANASETTLTPVDPTADNTINIPNASGTMAVSASGALALSAAGDVSVSASGITEAMLKVVDAPADEECFTYESTTGDFEWQDCAASVGTGAFLKLDASNDPITDQLAISGSNPTGMLSVINTNSASGPAFTIQNSADAASVVTGYFYGSDRATAAAGDDAQIRFYIEDSAGNQQQAGSILWTLNTVTNAAENGGFLINAIAGGSSLEMVRFSTPTSGQASNTFNENGVDVDFRVEVDNNANAIFCNATADSCTFGSQTELGFIGIDGTADEIQFTVQGNATQTSDLVVFENSAGTDQITFSVDGLITDYGAEATAARGVPAIVASIARTGQTAAIAATTLYTAPAVDTTVRVSAYTIVTTAATTSSTLGSLGIVYTDADNAVSQNMTLRCNNRTGTSVTSVTGNTTTTSLNCEAFVRMNASSTMTYEQGYASSGATAMAYSTYWTVERLQ